MRDETWTVSVAPIPVRTTMRKPVYVLPGTEVIEFTPELVELAKKIVALPPEQSSALLRLVRKEQDQQEWKSRRQGKVF